MGEETESRHFLGHIPDDYGLVVGTAYYGLAVVGDGESSHPVLVACEGPLAVTSADFPHLDGFVPGARKDHIASRVEQHVGNVMVVTEESLEALVVVVSVPDLDGQVGRTRG